MSRRRPRTKKGRKREVSSAPLDCMPQHAGKINDGRARSSGAPAGAAGRATWPDAREEQRDADPDDNGRRADDQRPEEDPQRADHQQNAAEKGPSGSGNLQRAHVAAESDRREGPQQQPEPEEERQRGGREGDVRNENDTEDDLDDSTGKHPPASGDEVPVDRRENDLKHARQQHQPPEEHREPQIAPGRKGEDEESGDEERGANDKQQPPVADGLL